jgi:hypothetical protein
MTRALTIDFGRKRQSDGHWSGPLRPANIVRNKFPTYKNGSNGIVVKLADGPEMPSLKDVVAKETADLLDRRQRLSVRELTMKFEKGFNTATLLTNEVWTPAVQFLETCFLNNWFN